MKLWFKAKRYGWGWYPATWEGWVILAMYLFSFISMTVFANRHSDSVSDFLMQFLPNAIILLAFLIIICYTRGEKPGWRWGDKKNSK
jgi:hypothetical protein